MSVRSGLRAGLIASGITIFLILIGIPSLMGALLQGIVAAASPALGWWMVLALLAFWAGTSSVRRQASDGWGSTLAAGLVAGVVFAVPLALMTAILGQLITTGVDLRTWLVQLGSDAIALLTLGRPPLMAALPIVAVGCVGALAGALFSRLRANVRRPVGEKSTGPGLRMRMMNVPLVRDVVRHPLARSVALALLVILVLALPLGLNQYWNYTLGTVGIYVILGLGLNIIVGMSGLLVLGYSAFFAVGAYTVAMLTAPQPHGIMMNYWLTLPIAIVLAALSAVLIGLPVLRIRGDYLAIVTLGFGEIIRILMRSDVLLTFSGGPRGIRDVGHPMLFGRDIGNEFYFMYIILISILLVIFITRRIENSRVGRAWKAMREDERVAEAMGIYMLKYKLLAFAIGAAFAGLGGAIFASRNSFTGPEDFTLLVSINVLALLIVGGMGSIPGIILGAFVLKGLPEILRQLSDYRILAFGALLVVMMIVRPQGLWPAGRTLMERRRDAEVPSEGSGDAQPRGDAA